MEVWNALDLARHCSKEQELSTGNSGICTECAGMDQLSICKQLGE
jgi:hypothetical protein